MAEPLIRIDTRRADGGRQIGFATLNAATSLNALSLEMAEQLLAQLREWHDDPSIACVVLQGAGEKAFCAGGDITALYRWMTTTDFASVERYFVQEYTLDYFLHSYPKPVLCWGHGIVMGGGLGLLVASSHRVVTEDSRVATPEVAIGLYPDVGASWFLPRIPGRSGLYVGLTGAHLNAADALFASLADYFIPNSEREEIFEQLLSLSWNESPGANRHELSRLLRNHQRKHAVPESNLRKHFDLIGEITDHDSVEEILQALESRVGGESWLQRAAQTLRSGSPTSAKVIFEIYRRTPRLSLKDTFALELGLTMQFAQHPDFREGIRARLIDKDNQPRWSPPTLDAVGDAYVEEHFASPWPASRHPFRNW
jgi:enoyl-CoA hydratase/carnithine racemase